MKKYALLWICFVAVFIAADGVLHALSVDNILENGGLEEWDAIHSRTSDRLAPKVPEGEAPKGFTFDVNAKNSATGEVVITRDVKIKHEGRCSVKIENSDAELTGCLGLSEMPIEPNSRYKGRLWVKYKDISGAPSSGVMIVLLYGPADNFWGNPSVKRERFHPKDRGGESDWQPVEFSFETGPEDTVMAMSCYLQWTPGSVWFDDFEVIRVGSAGEKK